MIAIPPRTCRSPLLLMLGLAAGALSAPSATLAQDPARNLDSDDLSPYSELELIVDPGSVRQGETFTVALRVALEPGWHTYWLNGGDAGLPLAAAWNLPDGFVAGPLELPVPKLIPAAPLMSYGYEDELVALTRVTAPDRLPDGEIVLVAAADWLVCADVCFPAMGEASAVATPGERIRGQAERARTVIEAARGRLPAPAEEWRTRAWAVENGYVLEVEPPTGQELPAPYFFVDEVGMLEHAASQRVVREGATVRMFVTRSPFADEPAPVLRGLLAADAGVDHGAAWTIELAVEPAEDDDVSEALASLLGPAALLTGGVVPAADRVAGAGGSDVSLTLGMALLLALGGGLLLNLMPCVFPVLAVKVLGFVQQGGAEPQSTRRHAFAFAGGVMLSLWLLAGVLLGLRAAGQSLGWGFQLQSPGVVAVLALLLFALALNLSGVFELGLGMTRLGAVGGGERHRDSFLTGALAVVVATPCTAPFMGAALGYALLQPPLVGLAVFSGLGVGLAAPYVLLANAPGLLRRLPAPGPWMVGLKQALAFPLYLSVVWLTWVFGRQLGVDATAVLLLSLTFVGVAAWSTGRSQMSPMSPTPASRLITAGAVALAVAAVVSATQIGAPPLRAADAGPLAWEAFTPARVVELRADGRPVFVDFTAAWCLTCQVNERVAFGNGAVQRALADADVALLRADWTNRDPVISEALASFGRGGVPLYVLYPAGGASEPAVLPALLTPGVLLDAVDRASGQEGA